MDVTAKPSSLSVASQLDQEVEMLMSKIDRLSNLHTDLVIQRPPDIEIQTAKTPTPPDTSFEGRIRACAKRIQRASRLLDGFVDEIQATLL